MIVNGTTYKDTTPRMVVDNLEQARARGERVRLFYGDTNTGECWMDENDVTGYIGRSCGPVKIPLIIHNRRCLGGPGILDDCIIRIIRNGADVYRHPRFNQPKLNTCVEKFGEYPIKVFGNDGRTYARFFSEKQAQRWIDFMEGRRMTR